MTNWQDIENGIAVLEQRTEEMREHGEEYALADADYRKKKALAILDERQKGTPATICKDVIFARPDVQDALTRRNCSRAVYEADREAINTTKLRLKVLDAQEARDFQAAGQRGF